MKKYRFGFEDSILPSGVVIENGKIGYGDGRMGNGTSCLVASQMERQAALQQNSWGKTLTSYSTWDSTGNDLVLNGDQIVSPGEGSRTITHIRMLVTNASIKLMHSSFALFRVKAADGVTDLLSLLRSGVANSMTYEVLESELTTYQGKRIFGAHSASWQEFKLETPIVLQENEGLGIRMAPIAWSVETPTASAVENNGEQFYQDIGAAEIVPGVHLVAAPTYTAGLKAYQTVHRSESYYSRPEKQQASISMLQPGSSKLKGSFYFKGTGSDWAQDNELVNFGGSSGVSIGVRENSKLYIKVNGVDDTVLDVAPSEKNPSNQPIYPVFNSPVAGYGYYPGEEVAYTDNSSAGAGVKFKVKDLDENGRIVSLVAHGGNGLYDVNDVFTFSESVRKKEAAFSQPRVYASSSSYLGVRSAAFRFRHAAYAYGYLRGSASQYHLTTKYPGNPQPITGFRLQKQYYSVPTDIRVIRIEGSNSETGFTASSGVPDVSYDNSGNGWTLHAAQSSSEDGDWAEVTIPNADSKEYWRVYVEPTNPSTGSYYTFKDLIFVTNSNSSVSDTGFTHTLSNSNLKGISENHWNSMEFSIDLASLGTNVCTALLNGTSLTTSLIANPSDSSTDFLKIRSLAADHSFLDDIAINDGAGGIDDEIPPLTYSVPSAVTQVLENTWSPSVQNPASHTTKTYYQSGQYNNSIQTSLAFSPLDKMLYFSNGLNELECFTGMPTKENFEEDGYEYNKAGTLVYTGALTGGEKRPYGIGGYGETLWVPSIQKIWFITKVGDAKYYPYKTKGVSIFEVCPLTRSIKELGVCLGLEEDLKPEFQVKYITPLDKVAIIIENDKIAYIDPHNLEAEEVAFNYPVTAMCHVPSTNSLLCFHGLNSDTGAPSVTQKFISVINLGNPTIIENIVGGIPSVLNLKSSYLYTGSRPEFIPSVNRVLYKSSNSSATSFKMLRVTKEGNDAAFTSEDPPVGGRYNYQPPLFERFSGRLIGAHKASPSTLIGIASLNPSGENPSGAGFSYHGKWTLLAVCYDYALPFNKSPYQSVGAYDFSKKRTYLFGSGGTSFSVVMVGSFLFPIDGKHANSDAEMISDNALYPDWDTAVGMLNAASYLASGEIHKMVTPDDSKRIRAKLVPLVLSEVSSYEGQNVGVGRSKGSNPLKIGVNETSGSDHSAGSIVPIGPDAPPSRSSKNHSRSLLYKSNNPSSGSLDEALINKLRIYIETAQG